MKIIAIESELPGVTGEQFTESLLVEEAAKAWELYQSGVIRELYFRADRSEAVLIMECRDIGDAKAILTTLPLVQANLIEFNLIPLQAYPGFARLFSTP